MNDREIAHIRKVLDRLGCLDAFEDERSRHRSHPVYNACNMLSFLRDFSSISISFDWSDTIIGPDYWSEINEELYVWHRRKYLMNAFKRAVLLLKRYNLILPVVRFGENTIYLNDSMDVGGRQCEITERARLIIKKLILEQNGNNVCQMFRNACSCVISDEDYGRFGDDERMRLMRLIELTGRLY